MTTTMKKSTRAEAKKLMWEYYRDNKEFLPKWIREFREEILIQLIDGRDAHDVFCSFGKVSTNARNQVARADNFQ